MGLYHARRGLREAPSRREGRAIAPPDHVQNRAKPARWTQSCPVTGRHEQPSRASRPRPPRPTDPRIHDACCDRQAQPLSLSMAQLQPRIPRPHVRSFFGAALQPSGVPPRAAPTRKPPRLSLAEASTRQPAVCPVECWLGANMGCRLVRGERHAHEPSPRNAARGAVYFLAHLISLSGASQTLLLAAAGN